MGSGMSADTKILINNQGHSFTCMWTICGACFKALAVCQRSSAAGISYFFRGGVQYLHAGIRPAPQGGQDYGVRCRRMVDLWTFSAYSAAGLQNKTGQINSCERRRRHLFAAGDMAALLRSQRVIGLLAEAAAAAAAPLADVTNCCSCVRLAKCAGPLPVKNQVRPFRSAKSKNVLQNQHLLFAEPGRVRGWWIAHSLTRCNADRPPGPCTPLCQYELSCAAFISDRSITLPELHEGKCKWNSMSLAANKATQTHSVDESMYCCKE